jgi:CrcB protein
MDLLALHELVFPSVVAPVLIFYVALGCAIGGICRYLLMTAVSQRFGDGFPWGTLAVNALGSFLLGLLLGSHLSGSFAADDSAFAAVGFCGGLTTFSTFSLQNLSLVSEQKWKHAAWNSIGSTLLCMLCIAGGTMLGEGVL